MRKMTLFFLLLFACLLSTGPAVAGPYTDDGIDGYVDGNVNPAFVAWATGYLNYQPAEALNPVNDGTYATDGGVATQFRTPENALGEIGNGIVTLGDLYQEQIDAGASPGEITLTFDTTIYDGDGGDFAVFENGFFSGGLLFAELAYVEVSTDGTNWARFDSISLTEGLAGAYGTIDPTDVHNLAGKHPNNYGTSEGTLFDLSDLLDNTSVIAGLVDLDNINYIKIIDIPGSGDYLDSEGNSIYDAWVTWGSGGFDLDGVGVINAVPVPGAVVLMGSGLLGLIGIRRRSERNCAV
jgi:hypothetical protein